MAGSKGFSVLAATGVQSEANLPYAGLHQLLRPLLDAVGQLPAQLRDAVLAAFGMRDSDVADRFLTALAALELLADAAHRRTLLVIIDDAQWLDTPTVEALGFIARRIDAEPIVMLIAVRAGHQTMLTGAHLPQIDLAPLDADSCSALLDRTSPLLPSRARRRILAAAAGNPLALVELPVGLDAPEADGLFAEQLPLTERLQSAFTARFTDLPAATRLLLLATAANDDESLAEALLATSTLVGAPVSTETFEPAVAAGLIHIDLTKVRFLAPAGAVSHLSNRDAHGPPPGARRACRGTRCTPRPAGLAARRVSHRTGPGHRGRDIPGRQARRSARWSDGGDRCLGPLCRPQRRRRPARSAPAARRRPGRSDRRSGPRQDPARRGGHRAAQPSGTGPGGTARARSTEPLIPGDPAKVLWLVATGEQLADHGHVDLALRFLSAAATQANLADPGKSARSAVSAAALRVTVRPDDPRLLAILAFAEPEEHGALIVQRARAIATAQRPDPESAALLGASLNVVGAFDLSASFLAAAVAGLARSGAAGPASLVLTHQAWTAINTMDWAVAVPAAEESVRLAEDVGQPLWGSARRPPWRCSPVCAATTSTADTESRAAESVGAADQGVGDARRYPVDPRRRRARHRSLRHRLRRARPDARTA